MKHILMLITLLTICLGLKAQEYPRYEKDTSGRLIVLMTVEQAQKLDNATDLLILFEKLNAQMGSYDTAYLKVISAKDSVISTQEILVSKLRETVSNRDDQIFNLHEKIKGRDAKITSLETTVKNKDEQITLTKTEMKIAKRNRMLTGGVIGIIIGLTFSILINK